MSVNNDHFPLMDPRLDTTPHTIREGMLLSNVLSMPIRGLNEVVGVAMDVAGIFAPFTVEVIQDLALAVYKSCSLKSWQLYSQKKINEFEEKYEISRKESEHYLHSIEELGIFAITLAAGKVFTSTRQGARNLIEQIKYDQANLNIQRPLVTNKVIEFTGDVAGRFDFNIRKPTENQLEIWVHSLHGFEKNSINLAGYGESTKTSGNLIRAFREIKELASKEGTNEVTIRWDIANKKLVDVAKRASKYLELVKIDKFARQAVFKLKFPKIETPSIVSELRSPNTHIPSITPPLHNLEEMAFLSIGKKHALKELVEEHSLISVVTQEYEEHNSFEQIRKDQYGSLAITINNPELPPFRFTAVPLNLPLSKPLEEVSICKDDLERSKKEFIEIAKRSFEDTEKFKYSQTDELGLVA